MKERHVQSFAKWIDVPCTARILRISDTSVRRYIRQGRIRATRLINGYNGNITLCNRDDVTRLKEEQRQRGRIE